MPKDKVAEFRDVLNKCGMGNASPINNDPLPVNLGNGDDDTTDKNLHDVFGRIAKAKVPARIVLVVLPTKSAPVYNRVKFHGDVKHGMQRSLDKEGRILTLKSRNPYCLCFASQSQKRRPVFCQRRLEVQSEIGRE